MNNPFAQPEEIWRIFFTTEYKHIKVFEDEFEESTIAISSHEISSQTIEAMDEDIWAVELYFNRPVSREIIPKELLSYLEIDSIKIEKLENKDWVADAANSLVDIKTQRFYITRDTKQCDDLIPVIINITRAFGTGEHATTIGCVEALELYSGKAASNILDIGTGTGILAICAKKLWPKAQVVGTDIDPVAIEVAKEHGKLNVVDIEFGISINSGLQFDIILANILARPLIEMASNIASITNINGIVILSGFLENQLPEIIAEYVKHGLSHVEVINKNKWITLILSKNQI